MSLPQPVDYEELRENGIVIAINRLILHPLGYDISVREVKGINQLAIAKSDDPEGVVYSMDDAPPEIVELLQQRSATFEQLSKTKHAKRKKECGFVVQPLTKLAQA